MLNIREKVVKAFAYENEPRFFNRKFNEVKHSARKLKQRLLRENKPISLEARAVPPRRPSESARERAQPRKPFQPVPFKPRPAIYIDKDGGFSLQPYPALTNGEAVCATYWYGDVQKFLEPEELVKLRQTFPNFNHAVFYNIWKQIDIDEQKRVKSAIALLPLGENEYTTLPESLTSLTDQELKQHIERQISCTLRHLRGDSIKNAEKSELRREYFQQTFVQDLGLKTRQKQEDLLRQGWDLYLKQGGVIYKETDEYKIATNIIVYLDKVYTNAPENIKEQCIKFVFGESFIIPKGKDFPKNKEEQEAAVEEIWDQLTEPKQNRWKEIAAAEMEKPFIYLSEKTWKLFFLNEYKAIQKSGRCNTISAKRIFAVTCYQEDFVTTSVQMRTVVVELDSGRLQATYQVLNDAFPDKFVEKLQDK